MEIDSCCPVRRRKVYRRRQSSSTLSGAEASELCQLRSKAAFVSLTLNRASNRHGGGEARMKSYVRASLLHCLYKVFECEHRRSRLLDRPRDLFLAHAESLRPATTEFALANRA